MAAGNTYAVRACWSHVLVLNGSTNSVTHSDAVLVRKPSVVAVLGNLAIAAYRLCRAITLQHPPQNSNKQCKMNTAIRRARGQSVKPHTMQLRFAEIRAPRLRYARDKHTNYSRC
jgi:hypothetical protein